MLANLKASGNAKVEKLNDSLGGGSFTLESAIYPFKVEMAYIDKSSYGSTTLNLRYVGIDGNEKSYRETINLTNNDGNHEVKDKKGDLRTYFGLVTANKLMSVLCDKDITEVESQMAKIKVYDFDLRSDQVVDREVLTELIGLPVRIGITKNVNNKKVLNGDKWENDPSGATKETNKSQSYFRFADLLTATEIVDNADEAEFHVEWDKKFKGTTQGKVTPIVGAATAGVPSGFGTSPAPTIDFATT